MLIKKIFLSFLFLFNISISAESLDPIELLSEFVSIDTINPPGNESRAVDFYAKIFEREGIEYFTGESAPGRGNIWARIKGGDLPALILCSIPMLSQHLKIIGRLIQWLPRLEMGTFMAEVL